MPLTGSVQAQKLKQKPGSGSTVKMRDFQWVSVMGDRRATAASPPLRAQPGFRGLMDGIKRSHFHQNIGGGGKLAVDEFKIAERRKKRGAATGLLLPSLARTQIPAPQKKLASRS